MKLTAEQQEKAIALRRLFNSEPPTAEEAWASYVDFTRAMAQMIDGIDSLINPCGMQQVFGTAWKSFAKLWGSEQQRLVLEAIGGDESLLEQVREHPQGRQVLRRILDRVKETKGTLSFGLSATDVDVADILVQEIPGIGNE